MGGGEITLTGYNLIDVGREKFSGRVDAMNERQLLKEIKKHLKSREVEIEWQGDMGMILVGGWRPVGCVTREGGIS